MARTTCLVCFISTVNGHSKKKKEKRLKCGASSRHIANLKQSIFSFDIYDVQAQLKRKEIISQHSE
jgi:hypothetical protein